MGGQLSIQEKEQIIRHLSTLRTDIRHMYERASLSMPLNLLQIIKKKIDIQQLTNAESNILVQFTQLLGSTPNSELMPQLRKLKLALGIKDIAVRKAPPRAQPNIDVRKIYAQYVLQEIRHKYSISNTYGKYGDEKLRRIFKMIWNIIVGVLQSEPREKIMAELRFIVGENNGIFTYRDGNLKSLDRIYPFLIPTDVETPVVSEDDSDEEEMEEEIEEEIEGEIEEGSSQSVLGEREQMLAEMRERLQRINTNRERIRQMELAMEEEGSSQFGSQSRLRTATETEEEEEEEPGLMEAMIAREAAGMEGIGMPEGIGPTEGETEEEKINRKFLSMVIPPRPVILRMEQKFVDMANEDLMRKLTPRTPTPMDRLIATIRREEIPEPVDTSMEDIRRIAEFQSSVLRESIMDKHEKRDSSLYNLSIEEKERRIRLLNKRKRELEELKKEEDRKRRRR